MYKCQNICIKIQDIYLSKSCISVSSKLYIGQSFKEVKISDIKNCVALIVKVESLKSIKGRPNISCRQAFVHTSCFDCVMKTTA